MNVSYKKYVALASLVFLVMPSFTLFAVSISVSIEKEESHSRMVGVVPTRTFGYDVKVQTGAVVNANRPPVAPQLPIAGLGGRHKARNNN
ncbi:MAG: hypothetical protein NUV54_00320 [Candidatus Taylorbacteria bacterium]|nr:hypothetical protein [Candidatus Taylorbacteria bacterium]